AQEHRETFLDEFYGHAERYPYGISVKRYPDPRVLTIHLSIARFPDLERWSLVIGDRVHCLRSTLDHLIYRIAINVSGSDPPPDENLLSYPIGMDQFWRLGILQNDPGFMAHLHWLQPETRPEWKGLRLLALLPELDNVDKHRNLNVMV